MQPVTTKTTFSSHATLALQMQRCYDSARRLCRDKFDESISSYRKIILDYREEHKTDTLHSIVQIISQPQIHDNASWIIMFMAAGVSILNEEPEK